MAPRESNTTLTPIELRETLGLTQRDVGQGIGRASSLVSKLELGRRRWTYDTATAWIRWAQAETALAIAEEIEIRVEDIPTLDQLMALRPKKVEW